MNSEELKGSVQISKEDLSSLPAEEYKGEIHLIDNPEALREALNTLNKASIIGFDTETRPCFQKGVHYSVALIQIATEKECFLIRINKTGFLPEIINLLENPDILKIGLSIKDDFHNLCKIRPVKPVNFIELQSFVKDYSIADNSLSKIYAVLFGKRISKSQRLSNWEAPELSKAQQLYASLDAAACINIYNHLTSGLFNPVNSKYYTVNDIVSSEEKSITNDNNNEI